MKIKIKPGQSPSLLQIAKLVIYYPNPGKSVHRGIVQHTAEDVSKWTGASPASIYRYWAAARNPKSDLAFVIRALKSGVK